MMTRKLIACSTGLASNLSSASHYALRTFEIVTNLIVKLVIYTTGRVTYD